MRSWQDLERERRAAEWAARRHRREQFVKYIIGAVAAVLLVIIPGACSVTAIPAGHVGVQVLFGEVYDETLEPGVHFVNPFSNVYEMDTRTKEVKESANVPSKEGLAVHTDVSILYALSKQNAKNVFKDVGWNYVPVIVEPQLRSVLRGVTARYDSRALYTADRARIEQEIFDDLKPLYEHRGIVLEKVLLRDVQLPAQVRQAIEQKAAAEQEAERMKFVLLKEKQEAERKAVEAEGIARFQKIVTAGIDERLLQWRAIEAVQELAKSNNSKFVILGNKDGLPMILDTGK